MYDIYNIIYIITLYRNQWTNSVMVNFTADFCSTKSYRRFFERSMSFRQCSQPAIDLKRFQKSTTPQKHSLLLYQKKPFFVQVEIF